MDHEVKMIQTQETYYETKEEITNYNRMLELENQAQERVKASLEGMIYQLRAQLAVTQQGTDDWYSLYQTILSYEEAVEGANNAIAANTRKIKENKNAVNKLRVDLEQTVLTEIKNKIQKERDMADATVQMETTILNAIKARYQKEWDYLKDDLTKKREALDEERKLIDERLQRRKDAEDEANKYEELAELQRQLASISMDSTRTRDAAALREKIAALEKEIAWDIAGEQAAAQKASLDDQIKGYEDRITYGDEYMQEMLANEQNFADEVNDVMMMSQDELFNWLENNVDEYINSLEDSQKQMIRSWEDTYKQMKGITDTYWTEVASILTSNDTFMNYMRNTDAYKNASDYQKSVYEYEWSEMYNRWLSGQKDDATYYHQDPYSSGYGTASSGQTYDETSGSGYGGGGYIDYEGDGPGGSIGIETDPRAGSGSAESYRKNRDLTSTTRKGSVTGATSAAKSFYSTTAIHPIANGNYYIVDTRTGAKVYGPSTEVDCNAVLRNTDFGEASFYLSVMTEKQMKNLQNRVHGGAVGSRGTTVSMYAKGGYIDETRFVGSQMGPIRVDGKSYSREMILDSAATKMVDDYIDGPGTNRIDYFTAQLGKTRGLLAALSSTDLDALNEDLVAMMQRSNMISIPKLFTNAGFMETGSNSAVTIGDIHVEINEAEINTEDDYADVARKVGSALAKEISRYGLSISDI